jgi:hypothetical protein
MKSGSRGKSFCTKISTTQEFDMAKKKIRRNKKGQIPLAELERRKHKLEAIIRERKLR